MRNLLLSLCFFLPSFSVLLAQSQEEKELIQLDLGWEKALLDSDVDFLDEVLADDFLWVHNHATFINGRESVLDQAKKIRAGQANDTRSRTSSNQQVVALGQTAVVSGWTVVDRPPSPVTYHFMRTYVKVNGVYKLLANHTMAVPEEDLKVKE